MHRRLPLSAHDRRGRLRQDTTGRHGDAENERHARAQARREPLAFADRPGDLVQKDTLDVRVRPGVAFTSAPATW